MKSQLRVAIYLVLVLNIFAGISIGQAEVQPPPGEMVDIGGYKIHLLVEGKSQRGPTVVFFHGAGDIALMWGLVIPKVGKFATAVAIDRTGEGWSEHGHGYSMRQQVYDSHEALKRAGFRPPYILVGHSLGGIYANMFAKDYRDEIGGVVFVDSTHPDVVLKIFNRELKKAEWKRMRLNAKDTIPPVNKDRITNPAPLETAQSRRDFGNMLEKFSSRDRKLINWYYNDRPLTYIKGSKSYEAEVFSEIYTNWRDYSLGRIPLIVITGGAKDPPDGDENWSTNELVQHRESLQRNLLTLSSKSEQVIAKHSGHRIQIDEPDVVVEQIKKLVKRLRSGR